MPVLALGISYRRAPVELLERLAFTHEDFPKAYRRLLDMEVVTEGVILSTCNRVEVFGEVASYHSGFLDMKRFLAESREIPPDEFAEPLYAHYEDDAALHLFSVAAGLDSMVLGEPQILGQMKQAVKTAEAAGSLGFVLNRLFQRTFAVAKDVRTQTDIGRPTGSPRASTPRDPRFPASSDRRSEPDAGCAPRPPSAPLPRRWSKPGLRSRSASWAGWPDGPCSWWGPVGWRRSPSGTCAPEAWGRFGS